MFFVQVQSNSVILQLSAHLFKILFFSSFLSISFLLKGWVKQTFQNLGLLLIHFLWNKPVNAI